MRQFIKNAIKDIGKYLGYSKKNENPTEGRKLKIYCYSGFIDDENGADGFEYSHIYLLSHTPVANFDERESAITFGFGQKTEFNLMGSIVLGENDIGKLSGLEKEAVRKKLYKKFGYRNLKALDGNIIGPFYLVYKSLYDLLESKRD